MDYKEEIIKLLKKEIKKDFELEIPKNSEFGDYSLPCFKLGENPNEIANGLSKRIKAEFIEKVEVKGGYLNFFIKKSAVTDVLKEILKQKDRYGGSNIGKNQKILIEHTSINPNASPHVGRARNALIGDSLVRIFRFNKYRVEVHYYVNDVGKQVAMLVLGCKNKKVSFDELLKIYININKEVEENPEKEKEIFDLLFSLEKGNKEVKKRFKEIVDICVKGQVKILSRLGIKYDYFDYESKYLWNKDSENVLKRLEKTGKLFKDEDGRMVLNQDGYNLAMKTPVLVLTRGDGTSLYPLRDIAYIIEKDKRAKENIIVLGEDQKLYFKQISIALELLKEKIPKVIHYSFVLLQQGKMSTRSGNLVLLEDFMDEVKKKAEIEIKKRKKGNIKNAEVIGFGALKYGILKVSPEKNVVFDWENALNFEGETGPYIQYAYARANSILEKEKIKQKVNISVLDKKEEIELIKKLGEFPNIVNESLKQLKPSIIANYAYGVAKLFSEFYHNYNVLKVEKELRNARLILVKCTKQVLENSLNLLGIEAPLKM